MLMHTASSQAVRLRFKRNLSFILSVVTTALRRRVKSDRLLAEAVKDNTPLQFKFAFGLRTLSLIAFLIDLQLGNKLSLASISRRMKLPDFSVQKPLYQVSATSLL